MDNLTKQFLDLFARYLLLIIAPLSNFYIFYAIFTPLTIYPAYYLFSSLFETTLVADVITVNGCFSMEIVGACVGGSAYFLLLIFNLATPGIRILKRISLLFLSFLAFLVLNILRIFVLGMLFVNGSTYLDVSHKLFWYFGSVFFVTAIWFLQVKLFKIDAIPFYSDFSSVYKTLKSMKQTK